MKRTVHIVMLALGLAVAASGAQAACYVEYKAKRDNPLELFYDVATVSGPCKKGPAAAKLQAKLARKGQTLLKVLSVRKK